MPKKMSKKEMRFQKQEVKRKSVAHRSGRMLGSGYGDIRDDWLVVITKIMNGLEQLKGLAEIGDPSITGMMVEGMMKQADRLQGIYRFIGVSPHVIKVPDIEIQKIDEDSEVAQIIDATMETIRELNPDDIDSIIRDLIEIFDIMGIEIEVDEDRKGKTGLQSMKRDDIYSIPGINEIEGYPILNEMTDKFMEILFDVDGVDEGVIGILEDFSLHSPGHILVETESDIKDMTNLDEDIINRIIDKCVEITEPDISMFDE